MPYQRTRGKYYHAEHDVLCLWLQNEEKQGKGIEEHQTVVYLPGSYLVIITGSQEMNRPGNGKNHDECQDCNMQGGYRSIIYMECKFRQRYKMVMKIAEVTISLP